MTEQLTVFDFENSHIDKLALRISQARHLLPVHYTPVIGQGAGNVNIFGPGSDLIGWVLTSAAAFTCTIIDGQDPNSAVIGVINQAAAATAVFSFGDCGVRARNGLLAVFTGGPVNGSIMYRPLPRHLW